jgi:hypothetical protein
MALRGGSLNSDSLILAPPSYDTVPGDRHAARPHPLDFFGHAALVELHRVTAPNWCEVRTANQFSDGSACDTIATMNEILEVLPCAIAACG